MNKPLTPKQEAFATGIAAGLSQAEAYRQAFPNAKGWKDESVWQRASKLAADTKVQSRVQELREKAAEANEVTIERIVAELSKVAFGDARQVMKWTEGSMRLIPSDQLTDDQAALVSEVKETTSLNGGSISLKTHNKLEALKLLGEHLGMFKRVAELTGKDGKPLIPVSPPADLPSDPQALGALYSQVVSGLQ